MTKKEFENKFTAIKSTDDLKILNETEFVFHFYHINLNIKLIGFQALFVYLNNQIEGWDKIDYSIPEELNKNSREFFQKIFNSITKTDFAHPNFKVNNYIYNTNVLILSLDDSFPYDCPETEFLIKVHYDYPHSFNEAFKFISKNKGYSLNQGDSLIGVLLAYEFKLKDKSDIVERRDKEKTSLSHLRSNYVKYISENELNVKNLFAENKKIIEFHENELNKLYNEKKKELDDYLQKYILITNKNSNFYNEEYKSLIAEKNKIFHSLEETYKEKLKLSEPAEYWKSRSVFLKRQGWMSMGGLVVLVIIGIILLYNLLWNTPEEMLTSLFGKDSNPARAVRWSIVFIAFISFLAFAIRALYKVTFSSFHLARDAEERYTLTFFYLSLINDAAVSDKERELIMQSLFSRADTGLLKDDSGPTMPGVGGLIGQKIGQN